MKNLERFAGPAPFSAFVVPKEVRTDAETKESRVVVIVDAQRLADMEDYIRRVRQRVDLMREDAHTALKSVKSQTDRQRWKARAGALDDVQAVTQ